MTDFEEPDLQPITRAYPEGEGPTWLCSRCGVIVGDRDAHVEHHRLLHDAIQTLMAGAALLMMEAHPEAVVHLGGDALDGLTDLLMSARAERKA